MVAEKPFVYDLQVIHEGYALLPELVGMHVAPGRVSRRAAGNPRGAFGLRSPCFTKKTTNKGFFVMLFVVCVVGSWHLCGDFSFRCLPQFVFVPRAPGYPIGASMV